MDKNNITYFNKCIIWIDVCMYVCMCLIYLMTIKDKAKEKSKIWIKKKHLVEK